MEVVSIFFQIFATYFVIHINLNPVCSNQIFFDNYFFNLDDILQKRFLVVFIEAHSTLHFTAAKESGHFGTRGPSKNTINYEAIYVCFSSKNTYQNMIIVC